MIINPETLFNILITIIVLNFLKDSILDYLNSTFFNKDEVIINSQTVASEDNNIELNCGHKFNYEALYNEVVYQKSMNKVVSCRSCKLEETIPE